MSTFSTLEIGKRAMQANNFGLDITSNNILNSSTEGYSRRQAIQSEASPFNKYGFFVGLGVDSESLRSFRQEYLDREVCKANSKLAGYEVDVLFYNSVETIMREPTDNNLGEVVNKLLYSFNELALQPESMGLRANILSASQTFVERLNSTSNDLLAMRKQANTDLVNGVDEANKLIDTIAEYNKAIAISKDISGNDALTYIDKREVAVEALSKLGNVTVTKEDNGIANVFINGINVVTGPSKNKLSIKENINDATGESTLDVVTYDEKKNLTITVNPTAGKFASSLKQYNVSLNPQNSSDGFSIMQTLDKYTVTFADKVNSLLAKGYGVNDLTGAAPGRVLFTAKSGNITAGSIEVSDSIKTAADLPLSDKANSPGNAAIGLEIARILQDGSFLQGQTPVEFYSNFIGRISQNANEALNAKKSSQLVVEQLNSTRSSTMGVNMNEEAISLIKFQKNLEAASKIIATNNQVLATIINLGK